MNLHDIIEAATLEGWHYTECLMDDDDTPPQSPTLTAAMLAVCEAADFRQRGECDSCEHDATCSIEGLPGNAPCVDALDSALCVLESLLTERVLTMGGDE